MGFGQLSAAVLNLAVALAHLGPPAGMLAQSTPATTPTASRPAPSTHGVNSPIAPGSINADVYRNPTFGFTCKIPAGWVLRTEEMNRPDTADSATTEAQAAPHKDARVLLAAFSRPPAARGEDINSSILIAAESAAAYPGLKDAAQYFGPLTEIAHAQGFDTVEEPYDFPVGAKTLVRGDFEKNVGSRVMHQSTLVMLARNYAISFTFIGGTEQEVDELVNGLTFSANQKRQNGQAAK